MTVQRFPFRFLAGWTHVTEVSDTCTHRQIQTILSPPVFCRPVFSSCLYTSKLIVTKYHNLSPCHCHCHCPCPIHCACSRPFPIPLVLLLHPSFPCPNSYLFSALLPASYRGLLLLFDYLYRAIHTVHIIRKFVGRSAVNLPYVDLRLYGMEKSDSECCTNFKNFLMVRLIYI
jgi:hypothetical protein